MARTAAEWLPILAQRLDARYPRVMTLRSYTSGTPPLPEMGENVRASWEMFQRKACTTYGGLAISSLGNRIVPNGIRIGESDDNEAVRVARRVWRDNRMDVVASEAVRDYLTIGVAYLVVGVDSDGRAVITREAPEQFIAATDPLRPWKSRADLKVWRDIDLGFDFAYVWVEGARQRFVRPSRRDDKVLLTRAVGGWVPDGEPEEYDGPPPVVVLEREQGMGFIEPHLAVIDRINIGKLQRLVITAMQAFRQRALKGGLPEQAEGEDPIDYAAVFEPAPGALWDLPEGIDVWESQQTDIRPLLEGEKTDARDFAAVTRTPISVFIPEGENQSAEGAASAKEGQVFQAKEEIRRLTVGFEVALVYALRVEDVDLGEDTVEMLWAPPEHVSLSEKYAAAVQAKAADVSWRTRMTSVLGFSSEEVDRMEVERATEQLQLATLFAQQPQQPAQAAQPQVGEAVNVGGQ